MDQTKLSQALNSLVFESENPAVDDPVPGDDSTSSISNNTNNMINQSNKTNTSKQNGHNTQSRSHELRLEHDGPFEHMSMISPAFTPRAESPDSAKFKLDEQNGSKDENGSSRIGTNGAVSATEAPAAGAEIAPGTKTNGQIKRKKSASAECRHGALVERSLADQLPTVFCESRARIPTTSGTEIFLHLYRNNVDTKEHLAIVFGENIHSKTLFEPREGETEQDRMTRGAYVGKLWPGRQKSDISQAYPPSTTPSPDSSSTQLTVGQPQSRTKHQQDDTLVRIHSECYTGETAWSARCDCGEQLDEAARLMAQEGHGVIVYLRQEGRGIGLAEKLKAYNLQDLGADTVQANLMLRHPADARSFSLATAILLDLGQTNIRLLTNNPDKIVAVEGKHKEVTVTQRVPMVPLSWQNKAGVSGEDLTKYLRTKRERMGHLLPEDVVEAAVAAGAVSAQQSAGLA